MPELPEVEVLRRDLEPEVVGTHIANVRVTRARSVRRYGDPDDFTTPLRGREIVAVERRGKYLVFRLEDGHALVVHLGMSGQLLRARTGREPVTAHTHVVVTLRGAGEVRFVDPRTFGEMFVSANGLSELAHLGVDPLVDALSPVRLAELVAHRRARIKPLLLDQRFIAGLGNIYTDEVLHRAGLRWDRGADSLTPDEVAGLHHEMLATLHEAIADRGSSLADAQYVDLYGHPGRYQHRHLVYAREGSPCPRCRQPITRTRVAGRSHFSCEVCQR